MVYKSKQSIVCVDSIQWANPANAAAIPDFFPFFDAVVAEDKALFPVKVPKTKFIFEIPAHFNGAHTGFNLRNMGDGGRYGVTVTVDAFTNLYKNPFTGKSITGFWGYLLPLHESLNVFTGFLAPGWPTDWWADHRSPFPSAMDIEFLKTIANGNTSLTKTAKQVLLDTSDAQLSRFTDKSDLSRNYDPEVGLFVDLFNSYGGFRSYASAFSYSINQDGLKWASVSKYSKYTGDDNHSENLSEYVIAYLHLGSGVTHNITSLFSQAGVGSYDKKIQSYTLNPSNVKAIANAHCSIQAAKRAGADISSPLSKLQAGEFSIAIAKGGTQASCPSECTFIVNRCVAKF